MSQDCIRNFDQNIILVNEMHRCSFDLGKRSLIKCVVEYKKCDCCHEEMDADSYEEHKTKCTEPENIPTTADLLLTEQAPVYNEPIDSSSSHSPSDLNLNNIDEDEDDDDVFNTPRALSPLIFDEDSSESSLILSNGLHNPHLAINEDYNSMSNSHSVHRNETTSEILKRKNVICSSCNRSYNINDNLTREISCPSHHIYCLSCLEYSMKEFVQNHLIPLCHPKLCNYKLSQYDICLIPLERRLSDQILKLAEGQQRPQCPKCQLYIDINQYEEFYEHVDSCPNSSDQLENHIEQCQNEKLINFIMKRTKYPVRKEQICFFIEQQNNSNNANLDPLSIINVLAAFGSTSECDACKKSLQYDDIYVLGCINNHKLCYSCSHQSQEANMLDEETLTCDLCANPSRVDGLNQLRLSDEH